MNTQMTICPLCKQANGCTATSDPTNCWCMNETFDKKTFEQLPEEAKNVQCICINCLKHGIVSNENL